MLHQVNIYAELLRAQCTNIKQSYQRVCHNLSELKGVAKCHPDRHELVPFPLEYALYRIPVSPDRHSRASGNLELKVTFQYRQDHLETVLVKSIADGTTQLYIDPEPSLLVFGYKADQRNGEDWKPHEDTLRRKLGNRLRMRGEVAQLRLPR